MSNPTMTAINALTATDQSQAVERALRTYGMYGGALRYLEKDKWHLCDRQAMQKVLDEFASALRPPQAVEREAAVPGGATDEMVSAAFKWADDWALGEYGPEATCPPETKEPALAFLRGVINAALAAVPPAHRPPQPGVVTEELRKLSEKAQQGRWHTNENHSTVLGKPTEHDETLFQTVCCAPHRAMSNPDRKRQWYADKAFIVASANFVRALLAAPSPGASVTASPADGLGDGRAICEALGFDPTNHHNALKCPYCNPEGLTFTASPADGTAPDAGLVAELRKALEKAETKAKNASADADMYANAWVRELGGKLFPKAHHIDACVKTTRWMKERSDRLAVIEAEQKAGSLVAEFGPSDEMVDARAALSRAGERP